MKTLAIMSQKGGAGKTTTAIHLAVEAETGGMPCLRVDLDPQASAVAWSDRRGGTVPEVTAAPYSRLPQILEAASKGGAQLVIIDTPPHAGQNALAAMRAADITLTPIRPSVLDLDSVQATLDLSEIARRPLLAVINHAAVLGPTSAEARAVLDGRGVKVAEQVIHQRVAFQHCVGMGHVAQEYEPAGKAATEVANLFSEVAAILRSSSTVV